MIAIHCFGDGVRFHHVGLAVPSIAEVCPDCSSTYDPVQDVKVAFVLLDGLSVELIEPVSEKSPVAASVKNGTKLLHICYEVDDLQAAILEGRKNGFHVIRPRAPAAAFGQRTITFLFSRTYGLVELLEASGKDA